MVDILAFDILEGQTLHERQGLIVGGGNSRGGGYVDISLDFHKVEGWY